jgi:hypothetical protein
MSADGVQRYGDVSVVFNELFIVTGDVQEGSEVFTVVRLRPILDRTGFMFLDVDAILVNFKSTEVDLLKGPGTFWTVSFKTMFRQQVQHFSDM